MKDIFKDERRTGSKALVIGLGGGCDILFAYAVAMHYFASGPIQSVYGNTKHEAEADFEPITDHIFRLPAPSQAPRSTRYPKHCHTKIDRMVPRGPEGCPHVFLVPEACEKERFAEEPVA